jgi:hypothetical protein
LKPYLENIRNEIKHHHKLFSEREFQVRECLIFAKMNVIKGQYEQARIDFQKVIDISNSELTGDDDYYDDDKSSLSVNQLQYATYLTSAYDSLIEILLLYYNLDESRDLLSKNTTIKEKYFDVAHPSFGYSKFLEVRQSVILGNYRDAYEKISELVVVESPKYNEKSIFIGKYLFLQADIETILGMLGNIQRFMLILILIRTLIYRCCQVKI